MLCRLTVALTVFALAGNASAQSDRLVGEGRLITRVDLYTDLDVGDQERAREFIHMRIGEPLSADSVRQALLNIQGSGLASEVEVRSRLDGDGVRVLVAAWSNTLIESVGFEGDSAFRRDLMGDLVEVRVGRPLISQRVVRSVYSLWDRHEEDGFLEAVVLSDLEIDERRNKVGIVFNVESGPRSMVGSIDFEGELGPVTPEQLLGSMESSVGDRYWPQRVRRDTDALQRYLIKQGFRTARVSGPETLYDWDSHQMSLVYSIEIGPPVEVTVVGADMETLREAGVLGFLGEQGYDPALLTFSVQRTTTWYQGEGYYFVDVEAKEERDEDLIQILMTIAPGSRFELKKIRLEGNESFDEATLRQLMATTERRAFTPGSGRLVDETLTEDLRNLRSYYALQGFAEAEVGPGVVLEGAGKLELTVPIVEGPRRSVGSLCWEGVEQMEPGPLEKGLPLRVDGPYHPTLLTQAENEVRARYRDAGYDSALVSSTVTFDVTGERAHVVFRVLEGQQTTVRRLVVRGQQHTSPWVLRDAIGLEAGDPVSRSRLLEIQRRLYALGIFTSVEVALAQGELLSGERDVVVQLEEGDRHRISVGGGVDTEDGLRGLFGYSLGNLAGRAASLHLDVVVSQREELYRLLVLQPAASGLGVPVQYSIFRTREEERILSDAFKEDFVTTQSGVQAEAKFASGILRLPLLYTYKQVDNNASEEVEEILFDREKAKVRISSVTGALQVDKRDNPVSPTEGRNTVLQLEYAFPFFSADEDFLKLFIQQTKYINMGSLGVIGASLRLGGIESFRDPAPDSGAGPEPDCTADSIPDFGVALSERFFAGGRATHRAYKLDALGIPGQTLFANRTEVDGTCETIGYFTTGGNGLALLNLDYRYPFMPGFWATTFFDTGNIWADWRDIALDDLKKGLGVGVLWDSPVGPLRLEIGWKLDREPFEDPYQVFFSFGTVF